MEQSNLIYKSLSEINKGIEAIGKSKTNTQQGFKYRGIDDVMNELHSLFAKNEVIICPKVNEIKREERLTKNGGVMFYTHLTIDFVFIASDGSFITSTVIGEAMDSADKGTNKAMSIALKYALLQMFLIPTEEDKDPDKYTHEVKPISIGVAFDEMDKCTTKEQAAAVWKKYPQFQKDADFIELAKSKNK